MKLDLQNSTSLKNILKGFKIKLYKIPLDSEGNLEIRSPSGVDITLAHTGTATHLFASHTDATDATISRGSSVTFKGRISLTHTEGDVIAEHGDVCFTIPSTEESLSPMLSVVPLQFLAYYAALALNRDVDRPRNLAKSVTVE